jgi:hypothetical protein
MGFGIYGIEEAGLYVKKLNDIHEALKGIESHTIKDLFLGKALKILPSIQEDRYQRYIEAINFFNELKIEEYINNVHNYITSFDICNENDEDRYIFLKVSYFKSGKSSFRDDICFYITIYKNTKNIWAVVSFRFRKSERCEIEYNVREDRSIDHIRQCISKYIDEFSSKLEDIEKNGLPEYENMEEK